MMNTQNKEDIPTRNLKKKKKQQKYPKLDTFHVVQKKKQKKNGEALRNFQILPRT